MSQVHASILALLDAEMFHELDKIVVSLRDNEKSEKDEESKEEEDEDGESEQAVPVSKPPPTLSPRARAKTSVWTDADVLLLICAWNTVIDETTCTVDQSGVSFEDHLHHHFSMLSGASASRTSHSLMLQKQALVVFADFVSEYNCDTKQQRRVSNKNHSWFLWGQKRREDILSSRKLPKSFAHLDKDVFRRVEAVIQRTAMTAATGNSGFAWGKTLVRLLHAWQEAVNHDTRQTQDTTIIRVYE